MDLKENELVIKCKECHKKFPSRKTFTDHVRKIHKGMDLEPELVLDETKETLSKPKTYSILPKPKKGRWIVQLERMNVFNVTKECLQKSF